MKRRFLITLLLPLAAFSTKRATAETHPSSSVPIPAAKSHTSPLNKKAVREVRNLRKEQEAAHLISSQR